LEITLNNKKSYKATLVGTDVKMDIALLKIDTDEKLPYSTFADSDQVKVGEWVLAVGNPYNLNSTVTAGIVSAKARNLDTRGIQSFIQTDAAVNPGNSGGALVNTRGELIGINTMISSPTGSYAGYSFAVPSNITRKIIEDIMEFGNVQRGILGIEGGELSSKVSKDMGIKDTEGFYVSKVNKNSGAEKAGLQVGDVIKKLDNQKISSYAELAGYINTKRPNDKVQVTFVRDGETKNIPVTLVKNDIIITELKGLELENVSATDKKKYKIDYGVRIKEVNNERLKQYEDELVGSIILNIDGSKAVDVETVSRLMSNKDDSQGTSVQLILKNGQIMRIII
jgi:S1-C subfamily serine protease